MPGLGRASVPSAFEAYWSERLKFLDVHYHVNPDGYVRRYDAVEAGAAYSDLGGGVVLKNHLGCCVAMASMAQRAGHAVFGSVVLNEIAGGVSLWPVRQSLCFRNGPNQGRLIVHLPTVTVHRHRSVLSRQFSNEWVARHGQAPVAIRDEGGRLTVAVHELLAFAQDEDVVISTGHANKTEVLLLVEAADRRGGITLMLNQPANPITGMTAADLMALGPHEWLFVEQTALTVLLGYQDMDDFGEVLRSVPNVVYSSDLGQTSQMTPAAWWEQSQAWFRRFGLSEDRIRDVTLANPLRMLSPRAPAPCGSVAPEQALESAP